MTRFLQKIKDLQAKIEAAMSVDDFDDIKIRRAEDICWIHLTKGQQRKIIQDLPASVYTHFTAFPVTPLVEILLRSLFISNEELAVWVVTKMIDD